MPETLIDLIKQAKALVGKHNVPNNLTPDWEGTNHYELQGTGEDFFWLHCEEALSSRTPSDTEEGVRLGYCLDAGALLPRLVEALTGDNSYAQGFRDGEETAQRKYEAEKSNG